MQIITLLFRFQVYYIINHTILQQRNLSKNWIVVIQSSCIFRYTTGIKYAGNKIRHIRVSGAPLTLSIKADNIPHVNVPTDRSDTILSDTEFFFSLLSLCLLFLLACLFTRVPDTFPAFVQFLDEYFLASFNFVNYAGFLSVFKKMPAACPHFGHNTTSCSPGASALLIVPYTTTSRRSFVLHRLHWKPFLITLVVNYSDLQKSELPASATTALAAMLATQCLTQCPQAYKFGLIPSLLYILLMLLH